MNGLRKCGAIYSQVVTMQDVAAAVVCFQILTPQGVIVKAHV